MTEVIKELYFELEQLRTTLNNATVSKKLKKQLDDLLLPVMANEMNRRKITDIINGIGDFTENILVPLLEQYASADMALRVKFLVEDLLVLCENYRDDLIKTLEKKQILNGSSSQRMVGKGMLTVSSATSHYRQALMHSGHGDAPTRTQKVHSNASSIFNVNTGKSMLISASKHGRNTTHLMMKTKVKRTSFNAMAAIVIDDKDNSGALKESPKEPKPQLSQSGQVLIKVSAVALNASDDIGGDSADIMKRKDKALEGSAEPPHLTQLRALSHSFISLASSTNSKLLRKPNAKPKKKSNIIGQEFCGTVEDIPWSKGELVHKLHVSKGDFVYGVLREGRGAMGEYIVCDIDDCAKVPQFISRHNSLHAARLGLDGGVVCRALAKCEIPRRKARTMQVLIVGGATNKAFILIELLLKDIRMPIANIKVLCNAREESRTLTRGGIRDHNVLDFSDAAKLADASLDLIFDCAVDSDNAPDFKTILTAKMNENCQYIALSTDLALKEKKANMESWQKEFNLLNSLAKKKYLSMNVFINDDIVDFSLASIKDAYDAVRKGETSGKPVVELSKDRIKALKTRT